MNLREYIEQIGRIPYGKRLQHRIKVNLKSRWVQAFDHRGSGQLLYFKERFLAPDHPGIEEMTTFSAKLRKLGITEQVGFGPTKGEFEALLARHE